jgi:hypothetical protein
MIQNAGIGCELPNKASRKIIRIMHPIPSKPGIEQPGRASAGTQDGSRRVFTWAWGKVQAVCVV